MSWSGGAKWRFLVKLIILLRSEGIATWPRFCLLLNRDWFHPFFLLLISCSGFADTLTFPPWVVSSSTNKTGVLFQFWKTQQGMLMFLVILWSNIITLSSLEESSLWANFWHCYLHVWQIRHCKTWWEEAGTARADICILSFLFIYLFIRRLKQFRLEFYHSLKAFLVEKLVII